MKRRHFLKLMAASGATASVARDVPANNEKEDEMNSNKSQEDGPMKIKPEDLVGYCGRYCGKCGICGFSIQKNVDVLRNVVGTAAFAKAAEGLGWPVMRDIAGHCCKEFEDQVSSFCELAPKLFPSFCRGGCVPPCEVARCCSERGFFTCAECSDMETCEKLLPVLKKYPEQVKNLKGIREMGVKSWAKQPFGEATEAKRKAMVDAVDRAFG
jgi:hypothetical protein